MFARLAIRAVKIIVVLVAAGGAFAPSVAQTTGPTVIYVLRHAERVADGTADSPLSPRGLERALALDSILRDVPLTAVYSSRYRRTRETVQHVLSTHGLSLTDYDARDLNGLAELLRAQPGHVVVSGHSNTTPEVVRLLGGDPIAENPESEYGRLYIVTLENGRFIASTLLHF